MESTSEENKQEYIAWHGNCSGWRNKENGAAFSSGHILGVIMFTRNFILPVFILSLALSACGKKDSKDNAATPVPAPAPSQPAPTPTPVPTPQPDPFIANCQNQGGTIISSNGQNLCKYSHTFSVSSGYQTSCGTYLWNSQIAVASNDLVQITASGNPKVYVGSVNLGSVTGTSFYPGYNGVLSFSSSSCFSSYSVSSVHIDRCVNASGSTVRCF